MKNGEVDVIFLVGNIGVLLVVGLFIVGCIKNIECFGLMFILLVVGKEGVGFDMLDFGVNVENKLEYLL